MRKGLLIALVILVGLTGIPLVVAMPGMACPDCGPVTLMSGSGCAIVIMAFSLLLVGSQVLRPRRRQRPPMGHAFALERPPRLA